MFSAVQDFQRAVAQRPDAFSDRPLQIFLGDSPTRDEDHRGGLWTDEQQSSLQKQVQENQAEWGTAGASLKGRISLITLVGSGAGEPMPWERELGSVATDAELRKSIKSFKRNIQEHEKKLANTPKGHVHDYWRGEMQIFREQLEIAERELIRRHPPN